MYILSHRVQMAAMQVHPDAAKVKETRLPEGQVETPEKLRLRREPSRRSSFNTKLGGGRSHLSSGSNASTPLKPVDHAASAGAGSSLQAHMDAPTAAQPVVSGSRAKVLGGPQASGPMSLPEAAAMAQVGNVAANMLRHSALFACIPCMSYGLLLPDPG